MLKIDRLFVLVDEPETEAIAAGAEGVATDCFTAHPELLQRLKEETRSGDRILFKASNSVGLSRVVEAFERDMK